MARREIRRDKVRTGFIWLMVALPVATICAIHIVLASNDLSHAERLELALGGNQASLSFMGYGSKPGWSSDGTATTGGSEEGTWPAVPLPGWGESIAEQEQAVSQWTGRPTLTVTLSDLTGPTGLAVLRLGIDATRPQSAGIVRLTEGRLPATPTEALVTPAGLARGFSASGTLQLRDDSEETVQITVVGVAQATYDAVADLVTGPDPHPGAVRRFLLGGDQPVTWDDAVRFADRGFQTRSRDLLEPPTASASETDDGALLRFFLTSLVGAAALLEVALVTGPAFAIGAARQRRNLALAAANGAPTPQLRRTALGQSILLGVSAAVAGAVLGTAAGIGIWPQLNADPAGLHLLLEVPVGQLAMALGLGIVAAIASALVAARGLGRLDLVAALRGGLRSGTVRRGAPALGAVLVVVGMVLVWLLGTVLKPNTMWVFLLWLAGAVMVLVGSLLLVPALIHGFGRLAATGPIAIRMALRETSRQQGRATSTVAAIMAGGIVLGVMWTMVVTTNLDQARNHHAQAPDGQAMVTFRDDELSAPEFDGAVSLVAKADARLRTVPTALVTGAAPADPEAEPLELAAMNPGCDPEAVLFWASVPPVECEALRGGWGGARQSILTGSTDDLVTLFGLDDQDQQALREGKLLVDTSPAPTDDSFWYATTQVAAGEVTFGRADWNTRSFTTEQVPVHEITSTVIERGASLQRVGGLISTEAAEQRGWLVGSWELQVISPDGPIATELETALRQKLEPAGFLIEVERGYQPRADPVVWGVTGTLGLLAVVAAAMATVLGVAELRPFLGTLAAVGADARLSRRLASLQAWLLGLVGTALGTGIGLAIGSPVAMAQTTRDDTVPPVLGLPWPMVAAMVLIVPLVAAGVARISVPAHPNLARRMA